MRRASLVASSALLLALAGCADPPPPRADAAPVDALDAQGVPVGDASGDLGPGPGLDAPRDVAPFDAGPPPPCTLAAFTRHVVDQTPGTETIEPAALARVGATFLVASRQGASRIAGPDAAVTRRDTIDLLALTEAGAPLGGLVTAYDSTASQTDLSVPAMVSDGERALVLFRESREMQGAAAFTTRVRGVTVRASGAPTGDEFVLADRGDPFAAPLPDGTALVLSARIAVGDGGLVAATPNVVRARTSGGVINPTGLDVTNLVPVSAESVLFRPHAEGARLVFRELTDVRVVRFDASGAVDTRAPLARGVDASRIDDAAALPTATVLGWDDATGTASHAIHAAVVDLDGRLLARTVLERFDAATQPTVNVTPTWGGAVVTWIRGTGASAVLRGVVVRPDGTLRGAPRDLLPVPDADGRMFSHGDGRALSFVARDRSGARRGLTFGRLCVPE